MHIEHAKLGEDGRLVIPAALRKEVGLHPAGSRHELVVKEMVERT